MSKVIAIVGMGPGIGMAVGKRFAREGFKVAQVARRAEALAGYEAELRKAGADVRSYAADAGNVDSLKSAFSRIQSELGAPEVLVYNAAVLGQSKPSTLDPAKALQDFQVNVLGALVSAQQVIPAMRAQKRGTLLFTGGGLALNPYPDYASLGIGKAGVRNLAHSLAGELEADGVHAATVTVCGFVKPGTHFDPDKIAEEYWKLHLQAPGHFEKERVYR